MGEREPIRNACGRSFRAPWTRVRRSSRERPLARGWSLAAAGHETRRSVQWTGADGSDARRQAGRPRQPTAAPGRPSSARDHSTREPATREACLARGKRRESPLCLSRDWASRERQGALARGRGSHAWSLVTTLYVGTPRDEHFFAENAGGCTRRLPLLCVAQLQLVHRIIFDRRPCRRCAAPVFGRCRPWPRARGLAASRSSRVWQL